MQLPEQGGGVSFWVDVCAAGHEGVLFLKSVVYHPVPFNAKPAEVTCLLNDSCAQAGQVVSSGSLIFCNTSWLWPHWLQR